MGEISLRIPPSHYAGLSKLLHLEKRSVSMLIEVLKEKTPTLSRERFTSDIVQLTAFKKNDVDDMLNVLLGLYSVRLDADISTHDFVESLCKAMEFTKNKDLQPANGEWGVFKDNLQAILGFDQSLGIISKAQDLLSHQKNIFQDARVFTDIRPVFGEDPNEPLIGGLIVHQLQINYLQDGETKEFFIALDIDDLSKLRNVLNRAEAKAESLSLFLKSSSILVEESEET